MRRPSGATNPITILVILAVLGVIYYGVCFGPKYLDNLDVREAVEAAVASAKTSDELMVQQVIIRTDRLGTHREEDPESGELVEKPGLALTPENITIDRDDSAHKVRLIVRYTRDVHLVPFNKWSTTSFTVQKEGTLAP